MNHFFKKKKKKNDGWIMATGWLYNPALKLLPINIHSVENKRKHITQSRQLKSFSVTNRRLG
jgi:hypothetical protein